MIGIDGYHTTNPGELGDVMRSRRVQYFMLICVIIILGLVSREISFVPLFIGDVLWGIMIFFIIQFLFIDIDIKALFLASLMICYMVEISQLYQVEWLNKIRMTTPGRLVLGQGFLWSDIISYTVGIASATFIKMVRLKQVGKEK